MACAKTTVADASTSSQHVGILNGWEHNSRHQGFEQSLLAKMHFLFAKLANDADRHASTHFSAMITLPSNHDNILHGCSLCSLSRKVQLPWHRLGPELCSSQRVLCIDQRLVILCIPGPWQGKGQGRIHSLTNQADSHRLKVSNLDCQCLLNVVRHARYHLHISTFARNVWLMIVPLLVSP